MLTDEQMNAIYSDDKTPDQIMQESYRLALLRAAEVCESTEVQAAFTFTANAITDARVYNAALFQRKVCAEVIRAEAKGE